MWTSAMRLQFAVRFAQMDLTTLRPGDWLNLRDDFLAFLGYHEGQGDLNARGGIMAVPTERPLPKNYTEANFQTLQQDVLSILHMVVRQTNEIMSAAFLKIEANCAIVTIGKNNTAIGWNILTAQGGTRDMFLLTLFLLLTREPTGRIRRCPECSTIFYRVRKQQYCSRPCTNRVNVRQWREQESVKEQEREQAHARYVAKVRQQSDSKHPGKVTPNRRPRNGVSEEKR